MFSIEYDDLESRVLQALHKELHKSDYTSRHIKGLKALRINHPLYVELVFLGGHFRNIEAESGEIRIISNLQDLIFCLENLWAKKS